MDRNREGRAGRVRTGRTAVRLDLKAAKADLRGRRDLLTRRKARSANMHSVIASSGLRTVRIYHGEFDPGSEQTLAACLKHASRAARRGNPP